MSLKKRIRDLERLLRNPKMPEELKKKKRPELEELKQQAAEAKKKRDKVEREKKYAKKYRYLKFIEKKKVDKRLRKARKALAKMFTRDGKQTEQEQKLRIEIATLEADLEYVTKYPKGHKYVSLYPNEGVTPEHAKRIEKMRILIKGSKGKSGAQRAEIEEEDTFFVEENEESDVNSKDEEMAGTDKNEAVAEGKVISGNKVKKKKKRKKPDKDPDRDQKGTEVEEENFQDGGANLPKTKKKKLKKSKKSNHR